MNARMPVTPAGDGPSRLNFRRICKAALLERIPAHWLSPTQIPAVRTCRGSVIAPVKLYCTPSARTGSKYSWRIEIRHQDTVDSVGERIVLAGIADLRRGTRPDLEFSIGELPATIRLPNGSASISSASWLAASDQLGPASTSAKGCLVSVAVLTTMRHRVDHDDRPIADRDVVHRGKGIDRGRDAPDRAEVRTTCFCTAALTLASSPKSTLGTMDTSARCWGSMTAPFQLASSTPVIG